MVPGVIRAVVAWLEEHALHHEGIWREPGNSSRLSQLQACWDRGDIDALPAEEPAENVAGLAVRFLKASADRQHGVLSEGVMDALLAPKELAVVREAVKAELGKLPAPNLATL